MNVINRFNSSHAGRFLVSTDHGDHEDILSNRYAQIRVIRRIYKNQRNFTDETVPMRSVYVSPRITGITRIFCVIRAIC